MANKNPHDDIGLAPHVRLAVAYADARMKPSLVTALALDTHLARIVAQATEPMLAQMRLAWWRDQLTRPAPDRPVGDPVLHLIGQSWLGREAALRELIDGWEALLADSPLGENDALDFATGRAAVMTDLAAQSGASASDAHQAGKIWALADLASRSSDEAEKALVLDLARAENARPVKLSRVMRPLAVLLGLARRSIARGGTPFLGDRLSPFVALRLGMLGR